MVKFYSKEMPLDVKSVSAEDGVVDMVEFKVLLNPKWVFDDSDRAKKVS